MHHRRCDRLLREDDLLPLAQKHDPKTTLSDVVKCGLVRQEGSKRRLSIVDDHEVVRRGVRSLVSDQTRGMKDRLRQFAVR